ncbi:Phospholipid/glycerol acyltransferase domain-containing protein [Aphelenchoides fujianensis]|nr:Phospholipid/glycerol acyltransferase domain-containing protein [Aphelenchoides fujianensis]
MTTTRVIVRELVEDMLEFLTAGVEAVIEDDVTERFHAAVLGNWNLLTRSRKFVPSNWKLDTVWLLGVLFRYTVLLPVRFTLFMIAFLLLVVFSLVIGAVPNEEYRIWMNKYAMLCFFRILSRAFSSIVIFHNPENRAESGIVVANHTTPMDVAILSCDNVYAMIGQKQGGFLGFIQKAVSRPKTGVSSAKFCKEHVNDPKKLPILIFPEGTCINNTSVMMFKKGSFEVSDVVHPIAMKYDNRLGDAFWNSSEQGYFSYLVSMMTSWAFALRRFVFLPAVHREEGEDPIDFARRVKRMIAQKGGLVDLEWDGNLKRTMVPEKLKVAQKDQFFAYLSRITPIRSYTPDEISEIRRLSDGEVNQEALKELEIILRRRRSINEGSHLHQD